VLTAHSRTPGLQCTAPKRTQKGGYQFLITPRVRSVGLRVCAKEFHLNFTRHICVAKVALCAHYIPAPKAKLADYFGVQPPDNDFKEKAYPGYLALIIRLNHGDPEQMECVPDWAEMKLAKHTYNARSETVGSKFVLQCLAQATVGHHSRRCDLRNRIMRPARRCAGRLRWRAAGHCGHPGIPQQGS
jgi:hypothetical protein